jgi:hypothetical protein
LNQHLPKALKVESKFTTGTAIAIPARELQALTTKDPDVFGVVATLFWSGQRDTDGIWFLIDAAESFTTTKIEQVSLSARDIQRIAKSQSWLEPVRAHIHKWWRPFLLAYLDEALQGHAVLLAELRELHAGRRLAERMSKEKFLAVEHRSAIEAIIESHGPSVAGHIFQDLLAYLLGLAGYQTVRINPIGVPDIEVTDLDTSRARRGVSVLLTRQQLNTMLAICQSSGELELAALLKEAGSK